MMCVFHRCRFRLLKQASIGISLSLAASFSTALVPVSIAPIEANFVLGMEVQGQRLNLYEDCEEGSVTCDNMLLVAPDLQRLWHIKPYDKSIDKSPYSVKLYAAKTKHSLCKDGVTPCGFQGYQFEGNGIKGFIDPIDKKVYAGNEWTLDGSSVTYKENSTYLPLTSQTALINSKYNVSDKALNKSYQITRDEVRRLYGERMESDLKQEQIQWIKQRSKDCGANAQHQPRTQAEKVCFIQQNDSRKQAWFLWID